MSDTAVPQTEQPATPPAATSPSPTADQVNEVKVTDQAGTPVPVTDTGGNPVTVTADFNPPGIPHAMAALSARPAPLASSGDAAGVKAPTSLDAALTENAQLRERVKFLEATGEFPEKDDDLRKFVEAIPRDKLSMFYHLGARLRTLINERWQRS